MTPERHHAAMDREPSRSEAYTTREVWWAFVVAGFRSKFDLAMFVLLIATIAFLFARGQVLGGVFLVGVTLFIYGRVAAAIGAYLGRSTRRPGREG
jgi:ABC-type nickel/cobalt efflux system permease component RcnA